MLAEVFSVVGGGESEGWRLIEVFRGRLGGFPRQSTASDLRDKVSTTKVFAQ